ncbi:MAG: hypothetical protein WAT79_08355 [Saprospiraceae bacterium]
MKTCKKLDGEICVYFIFGYDEIPKGFDKYDFSRNDFSECGKGDFLVSFIDSKKHGGKWFIYSSKEFAETFVPNVKEKVNEVTGEEKYKRDIEESKKVGTCKSKLYDDGKVFEYFYFTRNMEVFPEWFDTKKFVLESLMKYPYVVYGSRYPFEEEKYNVCIYDLRTFTNTFIIAKDYFWTNKDSEGLELRNHEWRSVKSTINVPDEKVDEKEQENLTYLGESTEAINWLYSLDPEVKNYLLDKYIKKSTYGEISILNIYKEEMGL